MNLQETITYYKATNQNGVIPLKESIPQLKIKKVVEEALEGNYHLSIVFTKNNKTSEKDVVLAALHALEFDLFDISHELSNYNIKTYSYSNFCNEIWFPITKEILKKYHVTQDKCVVLYKLKEKDELTFLIKTNTQYIFIQEIYWKS